MCKIEHWIGAFGVGVVFTFALAGCGKSHSTETKTSTKSTTVTHGPQTKPRIPGVTDIPPGTKN